MGISAYAEGKGFFHKGSGGSGSAPGDVCLSPPPAPTGPAPVPYVNMLKSGDLSKGSKSVKIDGQPTAKENVSFVSTSSGDEAGTQGGGVVTAKTKGKGRFNTWSFKVKVENKGAVCHGHLAGQNSGSFPPNCVDATLTVDFIVKNLTMDQLEKDCDEPYTGSKHRQSTTQAQRDSVNTAGSKCWQCGTKPPPRMIADHQPPENVAWEMGGCNMEPSPEAFKAAMKELPVLPHCRSCSSSQGGQMRSVDQREVFDFMNDNIVGLAI
ncbi:MAG: DUF4150 domain-containing protein [Paracoccaceae bacterium]|nr:DUF4150 domain-containing protein [Paracoccaceae bacterium]